MHRRPPINKRGPTVTRVAVMLRESTLSLARRQPVSTSLHRAVTIESGRLDDAQRHDAAAAALSGDQHI